MGQIPKLHKHVHAQLPFSPPLYILLDEKEVNIAAMTVCSTPLAPFVQSLILWFCQLGTGCANFFPVSDQRPELVIQDLQNFFDEKSATIHKIFQTNSSFHVI